MRKMPGLLFLWTEMLTLRMATLTLLTCSQNRQSTKFQNHENIIFVEKLYFFNLYNQVYIVKHGVKPLHSGFIFRENTSHLTDGFDIDYLSIHGSIIFCI